MRDRYFSNIFAKPWYGRLLLGLLCLPVHYSQAWTANNYTLGALGNCTVTTGIVAPWGPGYRSSGESRLVCALPNTFFSSHEDTLWIRVERTKEHRHNIACSFRQSDFYGKWSASELANVKNTIGTHSLKMTEPFKSQSPGNDEVTTVATCNLYDGDILYGFRYQN